jgi:predicted HicB family RNase H-like nuclease
MEEYVGTLEYMGIYGSIERGQGVPHDVNWHGHALGLDRAAIIYEGNTLEELRMDFEAGVDDYLDFCRERGKVPSITYHPMLEAMMSVSLPLAA